MPSERVKRRIDRFLDQAEEAAETFDWVTVAEAARAVLRVDPGNADALDFIRNDMEENQFWPGIWWVSDHGNSWAIDINGNEITTDTD